MCVCFCVYILFYVFFFHSFFLFRFVVSLLLRFRYTTKYDRQHAYTFPLKLFCTCIQSTMPYSIHALPCSIDKSSKWNYCCWTWSEHLFMNFSFNIHHCCIMLCVFMLYFAIAYQSCLNFSNKVKYFMCLHDG